MNIFPTETITQFTAPVTSFLSSNLGAIVGVFAFIVGLSIVMALFDVAVAQSRDWEKAKKSGNYREYFKKWPY